MTLKKVHMYGFPLKPKEQGLSVLDMGICWCPTVVANFYLYLLCLTSRSHTLHKSHKSHTQAPTQCVDEAFLCTPAG